MLRDEYDQAMSDAKDNFFLGVENQLSQAASDLQNVKNQLATAQNRVAILETDLAGARAVIADRDQYIVELRQQIATLEARVAELEAQVGGAVLYETNFTTNDGWSLSTIAKNHDTSWTLPQNVRFTPSGLMLDVKRETVTRNGVTRNFTAGELQARHVELRNYFEIEMAATMTVVKGVRHCPLWFRPLNSADGEIDLIESMGSEAYGITTVHSEYSNRKMIQKTTRWPNDRPNDRYVYRLIKSPGRIRAWIGDTLMFDYGPASPNGVINDFPWDRIFENPARTWYPRISSEVGCPPDRPNCTVGTPLSTFQSALMHIEYLKIKGLSR